MRILFGAALVTCAALLSGATQASATTTTVSILKPTATSGVSPIPVAASVNTPVRMLQLYVDGVKTSEVSATSLSASLNLPVGTHRIAVQALDAKYNVLHKAVKFISVTTPPPPPGTTLSNLQQSTNWETCGNCGNSGATGRVATYSMTRGITSPAIDNLSTSAQFSIGGPFPYTNGYWFLRHATPKKSLSKLVYDFYLYVPVESAKAPQAIEFECQHTINGYVHNFAWQADYASKAWRTFDYTNNKWIPSQIAFAPFAPGTWHHIVAEYHEEGTATVHDALTVDGVRTVVNITHSGTPTKQTWESFSNAFQLDLNRVPTAYSVYVDKMKVSYQ